MWSVRVLRGREDGSRDFPALCFGCGIGDLGAGRPKSPSIERADRFRNGGGGDAGSA